MTIPLPRLGRLPAHPPGHPHHAIRLSPFLSPDLRPRASVVPDPRATFDPYGNLEIGDCAVAAPANLVRLWTAGATHPHLLPLSAILSAYTVVSGYDPAQPASDTGAIISDVLALWTSVGAGGIGGDVLAAFAEIDHSSPYHLQLAVDLFGGAVIGVNLPVSAQGEESWEVRGPGPFEGEDEPGSWGGHCVCAVGYGANGVTVVSWGKLMFASWAWLAVYMDEAWAVVSGDFQAPPGVDLEGLRAELARVAEAG